MTKKSQKVKNDFKLRKKKNLLKDRGIKVGVLKHFETQQIDFAQVKNCIQNGTYENDNLFIRNNANNNGINPFPAITESILKDLGIF